MSSFQQGQEIKVELPFYVKFLLDKWADYAAAAFAALTIVSLLQIADRVPITVWIGISAFALVRWGRYIAEDIMVKKLFEKVGPLD